MLRAGFMFSHLKESFFELSGFFFFFLAEDTG